MATAPLLKTYSVDDLFRAEASKTQGVIIDVRSEKEFADAHVPGAVNVPLLNDGEREEVGILYKKTGPETARGRGLEIVRPKLEKLFDGIALAVARNLESPAIRIPMRGDWDKVLRLMGREILHLTFDETSSEEGDPTFSQIRGIENPLNMRDFSLDRKEVLTGDQDNLPYIEQLAVVTSVPIYFYCWRGGARSKSMTLFAQAFGFNASYLIGGHKAYRHAALEFLEAKSYPFKLCTLYGLTGSGKTKIIQQWCKEGKPVVDLEGLASHRGSAFGQVGIDKLGSQKDFENNLFWQLKHLVARGEKLIVVEGESRRIGRCQLPENFMKAMLEGFHLQVVRTLEERVRNILQDYIFPVEESRMMREMNAALDSIARRLGAERHKELSLLLASKKFEEFTARLLVEYYDKTYALSRAPAEFYHGIVTGPDDWGRVIPKLRPS